MTASSDKGQPRQGYARRVADRARAQREDVQEMREHTTRLELTRRVRGELVDAATGAAAIAAIAAGDEHALPRSERVERMRLEAQRLDLQLRARRELRTAAYGAGKLADTAADGSSPASVRAQEQLAARRRRASAMLKLASEHRLDLAVLDLDRSDRQALVLSTLGEPDDEARPAQSDRDVVERARARLAERAARAATALELADRFGLDPALEELNAADRAAIGLPVASGARR